MGESKSPSRLAFVVAVFVIGAAAGAVWWYRRHEPRQQLPVTRVTIAQFGDLLLYLPLYVAQDEGLFRKHGLLTTIVSTGGDEKTYAAVVSGSAQVGVADPTFVAVAAERGQRGKVIGLLIDGVPNYGVSLAGGAPPIRSPADLAGRKVATVPAPSTSYALVKRLYASAGLPPAIVEVGPPGLVPALSAGKADYALLIEPWVSEVLADGGRIGFSLLDYYKTFALTGLTASQRTVDESPAALSAVVGALTDATKLVRQDRERAIRVAAARFPDATPEVLRAAVDRLLQSSIYPECMVVTEESWAAAVELRREIGDLQQPVKNSQAYIDNRFAQQACGAGGTSP